MKKTLFAALATIFLLTSGAAFAQVGGWTGTAWITNGSIIQSAPLAQNLDWLFTNKIHKPGDCNADNERLSFTNGEWGCQTVVADVQAPANCSFNGSVVAHGGTVPAYQSSAVAFGESCQQEIRTCTNGTLSGSYTSASCSVAQPGSCIFDGVAVTHGNSITAYQAESVPVGESCVSEVRACTNGTLSGSYEFPTCSPQEAEPEAEPIPVSATWVNLSQGYDDNAMFGGPGGRLVNNCPAGAAATELRDDRDPSHSITEDNYKGGGTAQLCLAASGVTITSQWAQSCSAGMTHTGVYDSLNSSRGGFTSRDSKYYEHKHDLNEENNSSRDIGWCLGVDDPTNRYEVQIDRPYTTSCGSGWTKLINTRDDSWNVNNEDGTPNRSLCMRVVPKGYPGNADASGQATSGSGNSNGGNFDGGIGDAVNFFEF